MGTSVSSCTVCESIKNKYLDGNMEKIDETSRMTLEEK